MLVEEQDPIREERVLEHLDAAVGLDLLAGVREQLLDALIPYVGLFHLPSQALGHTERVKLPTANGRRWCQSTDGTWWKGSSRELWMSGLLNQPKVPGHHPFF